MAVIRPFLCTRPSTHLASHIAALPYDVYNRREAKEEIEKEPFSFLKIDRAETQLDDSVDEYDEQVYKKAAELFQAMLKENMLIQDTQKGYYIYQLVMNNRRQTGIVACASIDDYLNNIIKKHENTREEKELDRIRHVDTLSAQTGPIFLAYRSNTVINQIVENIQKEKPLYSFCAVDNIEHHVWKISDKEQIRTIQETFETIQQVYIADGHHRAASAVKVGLKRRKEHPDYTGEEEFNYFLSVLFPDKELMIMDYNRVVKDLNGYTKEEFLNRISENFLITKVSTPYQPEYKTAFGMYLDEEWYKLEAHKVLKDIKDPVDCLDVSLLQDYLLNPILGITDPRTDNRIDFIGGIRGLAELEKRVKEDMQVAFSMYPTSIHELFAVADANRLMPPKSTWFEPKLRSGLFIHHI